MNKQELIKKFLENKCNEEDADRVEEILDTAPDLLDACLPQDEWDLFDTTTVNSDADAKQEIWREVESATRKKPVRRVLYTTLAIAASILVLIVSGVYFRYNYKPTPFHSNILSSSALPQVIHNYTNRDSTFTLPDGSVVTVYPYTTIQYSNDFKEERTVRLVTGKATFEVAASPEHPFNVLSGSISTTALGTRFLVDHSSKKIVVKLYNGKVVVKYMGRNAQVYPAILSPGEQCFVNTKIDGITIAPIKTGSIRREAVQTNNAVAAGKAGKLTFSNVALNDAFDILSELFNQPIIYNMEDVEKMYFTGQFSVNDSLPVVLNIFGSVNGLLAEKRNGVIHIVKPGNRENNTSVPDNNRSHNNVTSYTNAPLEQVFSEMETIFHIHIRYAQQDVEHKYFTGAISSRDDVSNMLTIICRMNQLQLIRNNENYQVVKTGQTKK